MKKIAYILNIALVVGFMLLMVDPRYCGLLDTANCFDVFKEAWFWVLIVYFLFTEYFTFSLISHAKISRLKITILFLMLLLYLSVPYFYVQEMLYAHSKFATNGDGAFPMTMFTHVGSIIFLIVIPFNLFHLVSIYFKKNE